GLLGVIPPSGPLCQQPRAVYLTLAPTQRGPPVPTAPAMAATTARGQAEALPPACGLRGGARAPSGRRVPGPGPPHTPHTRGDMHRLHFFTILNLLTLVQLTSPATVRTGLSADPNLRDDDKPILGNLPGDIVELQMPVDGPNTNFARLELKL